MVCNPITEAFAGVVSILNIFQEKPKPKITLNSIKSKTIKPEHIRTCKDCADFKDVIKPIEEKWLKNIISYRPDGHPYTHILMQDEVGLDLETAMDFNWRLIELNLMCEDNPNYEV